MEQGKAREAETQDSEGADGEENPDSCLAFSSARSKAGSQVTVWANPFSWQSSPQDEHLPQRLVLRNDGRWRVQSRSFPRACPPGSAHHFACPSCWKSLIPLAVGYTCSSPSQQTSVCCACSRVGGPARPGRKGPAALPASHLCSWSPLQTLVCMLSPLQHVGLTMFLFRKKSVRLKTVF